MPNNPISREHENAIKIAVLETNQASTKSLLNRVESKVDELDSKIDTIISQLNRGKGAYVASLLIAGGLGGLATFVIEAIRITMDYIHK